MSKIVDYVKSLSDANNVGAVTEEMISKAESQLGLKFADEYKELLIGFGTLSTDYLDISSAIDDEFYNVVELTKKVREYYTNLSADLYVIIDGELDGLFVLQNHEGKIFEIDESDTLMEAYDSLYDFIRKIEGK